MCSFRYKLRVSSSSFLAFAISIVLYCYFRIVFISFFSPGFRIKGMHPFSDGSSTVFLDREICIQSHLFFSFWSPSPRFSFYGDPLHSDSELQWANYLILFFSASWPSRHSLWEDTCLLFEASWLFFENFSFFLYFKVIPRMLTPNSILFISAFEAMCQGWGFAHSLVLFRTFFKIFKANNDFLCFCGKTSLIIFISHKDSIKHWVEHFAIVRAKGNFEWGLDLRWGVIDTFWNSSPFLYEWEQLYFI